MQVRAKVLRVMSEDDGKTQKTIIALGAPEGSPVFSGAVSAGSGQATIPNAFAVIEITDPADVSRFKGGASITMTIDPS